MKPDDVHGLIVEFGKHKGELWTRVPQSYLKWILNEVEPEKEAYAIAEAEMKRRGADMPREVEISSHAIDRASLRVRKLWHSDRAEDEGLYSWLVRICTEVLEQQAPNKPEIVKYKGCKLVFKHGHHFPILKTVSNDKSYRLENPNA